MFPDAKLSSRTEPTAAVFTSILWAAAGTARGSGLSGQEPFLADLHLDQVIAAVTAGRDQFNLKPFFYAPLASVEEISYRHQVLQDLRDGSLLASLGSFAGRMQSMRNQRALSEKLHYPYQKQALFLDAATIYCTAVGSLSTDLAASAVTSSGFRTLRDYLNQYVGSASFQALLEDAERLKDDLANATYCFRIKGGQVSVSRYQDEADYSAEVAATFSKFQQGEVKNRLEAPPTTVDINHVEAMVLDGVAWLFPETFESLRDFCSRHAGYIDEVITRFDREVQFYLAYLAHIATLQRSGLPFCLPEVSRTSKELAVRSTFDLALAAQCVGDGRPVVTNDFDLHDRERIFLVSGPNQGGKTTFARTVGQLHYLAGLGLPVPGTAARIFLPDRILTHFEQGENTKDLRGKLMDDLVRVHDILEAATPDSLVILNEIFTSTALRDAVALGRKVMSRIVELDLLCVCVTFVDELVSLSSTMVSMVSTVNPGNPAERTFKVVRRPADGMAYARVLAQKYGLTYEQLKERLTP